MRVCVGKSRLLQKYKKGLTVASIGRLECSDIARAQLVGSYQRAAAPFEPLPREFSEEQIRHKAGVSTVAVREHMNGDEAMMVTGSNLYRASRLDAQSEREHRRAFGEAAPESRTRTRLYSYPCGATFRPISKSD